LQLGDSLAEFLVEATPDPKLRQLMMSMSEAIRTIAYKVCKGFVHGLIMTPGHCIGFWGKGVGSFLLQGSISSSGLNYHPCTDTLCLEAQCILSFQ
jgi:hypothetical protein